MHGNNEDSIQRPQPEAGDFESSNSAALSFRIRGGWDLKRERTIIFLHVDRYLCDLPHHGPWIYALSL